MSFFQPAVKSQLKARLAIDGPTGSGKTWTALSMATVLADGGKIAVVDTERDSARKYAHRYAFDVAAFAPPYDVHRLVDVLHAAEADGYSVVVIDSLSHFWMGEGGVLDEVDAAAARSQGNKFAAWAHGTPIQRHLVDSILGLDLHVVATMRSKMEYVLEEVGGKQIPRKIGMAPVQRDGLEYEFDLIVDLNLDHLGTVTKSRCDVLADTMIQPHREDEAAKTFLTWLNDGEPRAERADVTEHVTRVRGASADVKSAMQAWTNDRGINLERITVSALAEANARLDQLLAAESDPYAPADETEQSDTGESSES